MALEKLQKMWNNRSILKMSMHAITILKKRQTLVVIYHGLCKNQFHEKIDLCLLLCGV